MTRFTDAYMRHHAWELIRDYYANMIIGFKNFRTNDNYELQGSLYAVTGLYILNCTVIDHSLVES